VPTSRTSVASARLAGIATIAAVAALITGSASQATANPAGRLGDGRSIEQNSPAQLIPAPASALERMIGSDQHELRSGSAGQAGLLSAPIAKIRSDVLAGLLPQGSGNHPLYPGAVSLQAHRGVVVSDVAVGYSDLYSDSAPTMLPPEQRISTRLDTIYDLASLSKLFTSIVAMQLAEQGRLQLGAPVVNYLPAFASHGKSDITITNLLTHTSGFAPDPSPPLWQLPPERRVPAILDAAPTAPPNTSYVYSDLNLMTMALVEQAITGRTLDQLVAQQITGPLHLTSTRYNPPASLLPRIAAEEDQTVPDRGLVHGQVHDENAWALGGVAGHAGVFSDAHDLAILAQTLLNGGRYGQVRILQKSSVVAMFTNLNQHFPGDNHGYGFELYQDWYEGALATPYTAGHTGFTGTDIVIDPTTQSFSILLTNAVHPSRSWGSTNPVRRAVTDDLARAIPVRPVAGDSDWYSGMTDATVSTLTLPARPIGSDAQLNFALWYDTEPTDLLSLQQSRDGGKTWLDLPFSLRDGADRYASDGTVSGYDGHRWLAASATLAASNTPVQLRWRYATDGLYHGRGVYLDGIRLSDRAGLVFSDARPRDAEQVAASGFAPAQN
jgi:CubicO group peptidase (beta-lactamase class C family)